MELGVRQTQEGADLEQIECVRFTKNFNSMLQ